MGIRADYRYTGTVLPGSALIVTQTGTLGYQVNLHCEDGETNFVIWLTEKNKERAVKSFGSLGISEEKLQDQAFIEYGLGTEIEGREVSFGTKEETYKGQTKVKVAWIGKKSPTENGDMSRAAARFFGSKGTSVVAPSGDVITDDDIPF